MTDEQKTAPARPVFRSVYEICRYLEVNYYSFSHLVRKAPFNERYHQFEAPKRSGGVRIISAPHPDLRDAQRKLLPMLNERHRPHPGSHGFLHNRNIVSNAAIHCGRRLVLNIDLKDFFPSINFGRVRGLFMAAPFHMTEEAATFCAQICTHRNSLPQGAPTSPIVSNYIASSLDRKLSRMARQGGMAYSRYADDITLSTNRNAFPASVVYFDGPDASDGVLRVGEALNRAVESNGFSINLDKVRLQRRSQRQSVTGVTVNAAPNVDRKRIRRVRAMIHAWEKFGLEAAATEHARRYVQVERRKKIRAADRFFRNRLYGELAFLRMVRGPDNPQFLAFAGKLLTLDPNPPKFLRKMVFGAETYDVFVSHASEDKEAIAKPVAEACEKLGLSVFLDQTRIGFGAGFVDKINVALGSSRIVLAVISQNSVHKEWPMLEVNTALALETAGEKTVVPLIAGDPDLSKLPLLRRKRWLTWNDDPSEIAAALKATCDAE